MRRLRRLMGIRRRAQIDRALASYGPDPRRVLDDVRVADALRMLAAGQSVRAVAERFGTSIWSIYDLRVGRTYAHLPPTCLAVLALARHAAGFAALFAGWAAGGDYAQHSHRLQAQ